MTPEQATVGRAVVYRGYPDSDPEDGQIVSVHALDAGMVHVLYRGDTTAKATRIVDLAPVGVAEDSCADCGSDGPVVERRGKNVCDWCSHRYWTATDAEKAARGDS